MSSGKKVFTTQSGVQYILERYLTNADREELRKLNTTYTQDKFEKELIRRLERGSGSRNWIPHNYEDELVQNSSAIIGTTRRTRKLKNKKDADVYETPNGRNVYEDKRGRLRDYETGRYLKKDSFEK